MNILKKTTEQLINELNNRNAFWLAWAILWRVWTVAFIAGLIVGLLG